MIVPSGTFQFTSASVTEGHPDKVADQISDAILDACLARDPESRFACEALVAAYGHFGRLDLSFAWERNRFDDLNSAAASGRNGR